MWEEIYFKNNDFTAYKNETKYNDLQYSEQLCFTITYIIITHNVGMFTKKYKDIANKNNS